MLIKAIKRQIEREGLTEDIKNKIDILYLANRLSDAEYKELMGINDEYEVIEDAVDVDELPTD